ncbi:MAG: 2-C-methyl-D-erythritol 4-phosphate cytidylyltransferase [Tannerella sp.]|nr:2-C-methyl-D-erythritol 4-phosphate cytidylyltransferase [Tannerella sp.]
MRKYVIIVAGGKGLRMGDKLPKQFIPVHGKPVLMHTLKVFVDWNPDMEITVVLPQEKKKYWSILCEELNFNIPHKTVFGGETRFHSVKNALQCIKGEGLVAVHDGVRPFVTHEVIGECFCVAQRFGAAIPVIPMTESVREMVDENESRSFNREKLRIVQTPQVFKTDILKKSYGYPYKESFTDDASVVEAAGYKIHLVRGNRENIKITIPSDLRFASDFIGEKIGGYIDAL